jgi:tetratricopeptide (TPR) repeat protein
VTPRQTGFGVLVPGALLSACVLAGVGCGGASGGSGGSGRAAGGGGGSAAVGGGPGGGGGDLATAPADADGPRQAPTPDPRVTDDPPPQVSQPQTTAPALDLVDTVKTSTQRDAMSAFLVKPATRAAASKPSRPKAIVLYSALVVARGPGSPEAYTLAELWQLEGQNREAVAVLDRFIASSDDAAAVERATKDRRAWDKPDPFAKPVELPSLDADAKKVFKLGRAAYKKKKWGDAIVYFHMGYTLAPDLPGFLRELGATYDKLGAKDKKVEFYRAYLLRRPFGKNSDEIRKELKSTKSSLGELSISSSLPCDEIWLNRQPVPGKLPKKGLLVAPGDYKAFCISYTYEIGFWEYATVAAGGKESVEFRWAIIVNQLREPYGRIQIEDARSPGVMMDLGITNPEVGVVVPADGRSLKVIVKDDLGTRSEERYVKLQAGQRTVIKW